MDCLLQPVRTWVPISVYENNIDCLGLARQASSLSIYDTYIIVKAGRRRILLPLKGKLNKNKTIFFTRPEESFYAPSYQSGCIITFLITGAMSINANTFQCFGQIIQSAGKNILDICIKFHIILKI